MRILVTGGTGMVGRVLVGRLLALGHEVRVVSRDASRAARVLPEGVQVFSWAGDDSPPPAAALANAEAVVNLMGESIAGRWTAQRKERIRASRIDVTATLGRVLAPEVRCFVSASAIGYYPSHPEQAYDETFERTDRDDFLAQVVLDWEAAASALRTAQRRVVCLRIGLVLGQGGILGAVLPIFRLGLGGPLGDGRAWTSWIHVEDVAGLIAFALTDSRLDGPLNATAPDPVRFGEFTRALGRALHRPAFLAVPAFAVRAALGEAAQMVLGSQRVHPARALELGYSFRFPDLPGALEDILGRRS